MASLLAVSLDLDEVHHHLSIHGLGEPQRGATLEVRAAFRFALPRALAFARDAGVPLTLFAVADDLRDPFVRDMLRAAAREGHVVESHSASHPYDLLARSADERWREIASSLDAIEAALGRRPVGFRAPGYLVDDALFDLLERAGMAFDASVLPCPLYFAAKAVVRGWLVARGRPSASSGGGLRMALCPRTPYRPGNAFHRPGSRSFVELPMAVTPRARLPLIGTLVGAAPEAVARRLARTVSRDDFVGLELHAMDFLEASDPTVGPLVGHQPELRRPVSRRLASITAFTSELRSCGFAPATLEEAARVVSARLPAPR